MHFQASSINVRVSNNNVRCPDGYFSLSVGDAVTQCTNSEIRLS